MDFVMKKMQYEIEHQHIHRKPSHEDDHKEGHWWERMHDEHRHGDHREHAPERSHEEQPELAMDPALCCIRDHATEIFADDKQQKKLPPEYMRSRIDSTAH